MDWEAVGHTAEHAFMGALKRRAEVKPLKVEHDGMRGVITLEAESLSWREVAEAMAEANEVIFEGRKVVEHEFDGLEEARKAFPSMRAHERVSGRVRVVEIEGYDCAACSRRHANNTAEAKLFLVRDLRSKRRGLYEIEFLVGYEAAKFLAELAAQAGLSAKELACRSWELYERVRSLKETKEAMERARARLSRQLARAQRPRVFEGVEVYSGVVEEVEEKRFMEELTGRISKGMAAYAMASGDRCKVFVVQKGLDMNCSEVLKQALKRYGGSGGGREEFAMGGVAREFAEKVVEEILKICKFF